MSDPREIDRWYAENPQNERWGSIPIPETGVALDLGAFRGEWSRRIYDKNKCRIFAFEPVTEFYDDAVQNLKDTPVRLFNCGIGIANADSMMWLNDSGSSFTFDFGSGQRIPARMMAIKDFLRDEAITHVDVCKINIEGGEYELLEYMLREGLVAMIRVLLIQFHHHVPNAVALRESIRAGLRVTHSLDWNYEFTWEQWTRIPGA